MQVAAEFDGFGAVLDRASRGCRPGMHDRAIEQVDAGAADPQRPVSGQGNAGQCEHLQDSGARKYLPGVLDGYGAIHLSTPQGLRIGGAAEAGTLARA